MRTRSASTGPILEPSQFGDSPALADDVVAKSCDAWIKDNKGPFAHAYPSTSHTQRIFRELASLDPRTFAVMHGPSFSGDGKKAIELFADAVAKGSEM